MIECHDLYILSFVRFININLFLLVYTYKPDLSRDFSLDSPSYSAHIPLEE